MIGILWVTAGCFTGCGRILHLVIQTLVLIYCDYFLLNNNVNFKLWFVGGSILSGYSTALFSMNDQDKLQFAWDIGARLV